jgi:hypothetical protein
MRLAVEHCCIVLLVLVTCSYDCSVCFSLRPISQGMLVDLVLVEAVVEVAKLISVYQLQLALLS